MFAQKIHYWLLLFTLSCSSLSLYADSWRILFIMNASDNLSDMAFKNVTDMMRGKPNDAITFLVQMHTYDNVALRYQVTQQGLLFIEESMLSGNNQQDLVSAASWGFANNNADHTMLILSNHGWGILDPRWNNITNKWEVENDPLAVCSIAKRSMGAAMHHLRHKGYMFNNTTHTYLSNDGLITGLNTIQHTIFNGKKIDILAFDTCMGAMLEVAYQVAPSVHYMVGSQSCSLRDGFDYQGIMAVLNQQKNNPLAVATGMVNVFDAYYAEHDDVGIYTHAALDLNHVQPVITALNTVVDQILAMPGYQTILHDVRSESPRFCMWPMYTDTIEFFMILAKKLANDTPSDKNTAVNEAIHTLAHAHQRMVTARCGGIKTNAVAYGSAIYCPFSHIDSSYKQTVFAKSCKWLDLLATICQNNADDGIGWTVS